MLKRIFVFSMIFSLITTFTAAAKNVSDFSEKRIAVVTGTIAADAVHEVMPSAKILYFETVADKKEDGWFGRWRKFIVIFNGTLECGFDFQKARLEEISKPEDSKKGRINIYIPHCEILGVNVLFENDERIGKKGMRIYDQQGGWFSATLTLEDQNEVVKEALKTVHEKAVTEWKILRTAENNAVKLMKEFFAPLGYEVDITITNDVKKLRQPEKEQSSRAGGISEITSSKK